MTYLAWRRPVAAVIALLSMLGLLAACGGGDDENALTTESGSIQPVPVDVLPGEIGGLAVKPEDVAESLEGVKRSYLAEVGLFSLRDGDLLQATLQVAGFNDEVDYEDRGFQLSLVRQIGGSEPRSARMGDDTVFLTTSTSQRIAVWFRGDHMLVLATRDEFPTPRTLLRQALTEVQL